MAERNAVHGKSRQFQLSADSARMRNSCLTGSVSRGSLRISLLRRHHLQGIAVLTSKLLVPLMAVLALQLSWLRQRMSSPLSSLMKS